MSDDAALVDFPDDTITVEFPNGEYAIVEMIGRQTLVGWITEVERFGVRVMRIKQLFRHHLLSAVYQMPRSIYRFTPCTEDAAFAAQATELRELPWAVRATVPDGLLAVADDAADDEIPQ